MPFNGIVFGPRMLYLCNRKSDGITNPLIHIDDAQSLSSLSINNLKRKESIMIEYSIYMMGNPIKPEEPQKAYAKNQVREIWDLNKFCKHIASHNAGYSRGMVKAILSDMCDCIVEQLLNGNKIKLGEFGVFCITINCEGAESLEKFSEENIKSVNIKFNPGVDFENLVDKAEFKLVASRAGQAALLKAEKANETTVDLEAAKKKPTKDDNKPSGDGGDTPNPGGGSSTDSGTDGGDVGIE